MPLLHPHPIAPGGVVRIGIVAAILLMTGAESPWSGQPDGTVGTVGRYRLEVRGRTLGVEERWDPPPGAADGPPWVRRWFRWQVRGRVTDRLSDGFLGPGPWIAVADPQATAPPIADPGYLYAIPTPVLKDARARRRLVLETSLSLPDLPPLQSQRDGTVVLAAPLPDEIPRASRQRIDAAIRDVRAADPAGDCQDLSRALVERIGGEVAVGLAYFDEGREPAFYPHAWVILREDGRVIPIDPSLSQTVADATHLYLGPDSDTAAREFVAALAADVTVKVTPDRHEDTPTR